jgi:uncharacterized glyoxalase superfamily protein PhnB
VTTSISTVIPTLRYRDAPKAIEVLCDAFGFERHAVYDGPDGTIAHAELRHGSGMVMLGSVTEGGVWTVEPGTGAIYVAVDDADTHFERAREAGVEIVQEPTDQEYGSREYVARDPEGNLWSFGTYLPTVAASEEAAGSA